MSFQKSLPLLSMREGLHNERLLWLLYDHHEANKEATKIAALTIKQKFVEYSIVFPLIFLT